MDANSSLLESSAPQNTIPCQAMILAEPEHPLSWNYFLKADGHEAVWEKKWTSEQCSVLIDGALHEIRKHGVASGSWTLECDGKQVATARKRSAFKRSFDLETDTGIWHLKANGPLVRSFHLGAGEAVVTTIIPRHAFTRKAEINWLPDEVRFSTVVFSFWLAVLC